MTHLALQDDLVRIPQDTDIPYAAQKLVALGEMTAGIVHDFRNILAAIDSGLRLTQRRGAQPDEVGRVIPAIRDAVGRGLILTNQLLSFAKESEEPEILAADANQLLRELAPFITYAAGPRNRTIIELSADSPSCWLSHSQFKASILNLILNARDALPNGGTIRVSSAVDISPAVAGAQTRKCIRVRIQDDGEGMREEIMERIFDRLYTTKGADGTGLGLPQVAKFMRRVGGHLTVASEVGRGTTFDLYFPTIDLLCQTGST